MNTKILFADDKFCEDITRGPAGVTGRGGDRLPFSGGWPGKAALQGCQ